MSYIHNNWVRKLTFQNGSSKAVLEETLKKPENSVVREKLLKHKFLYEVQLSFLNRGNRILYYESDYDRDGFDLLFDNLGTQRHIQMKSILTTSKTNSFKIHRTLLRPRITELNYYPLSHDSFGVGYGGGVVLIVAEPNGEALDITYKYCDGLILCAFQAGYFKYNSAQKMGAIQKAFRSFQDPRQISGTVTLTKSCFLEFNSIASLFDYLGLGGCGDGARWNLQRAVARKHNLSDSSDQKLSIENFRDIIRNEFSSLLNWNDVSC